MLRHIPVLSAAHTPASLTGSCGPQPGIACRLVWDVSHNAQAAQLTDNFLAGPVHLLLRVAYVVVLALVIRAVLHRVINRLTERAARTLLPQFSAVTPSRLVPGRLVPRRRRDKTATDTGGPEGEAAASPNGSDPTPNGSDPAPNGSDATPAGGDAESTPEAEQLRALEAVTVAEAESSQPGPAETAGAAAGMERAMIDERRHQRVRALGSILRSAASITVFAIAGVVILGDLGINLAPLLASAGVVGVAVGFGAQNLVRDYLSGIFMLIEDQYGVGDVITVGEATGTVETVTLRLTRLRDVNGIVWHIRNGTIEQVGNESQGWARAVIDFPVPYLADLSTIRTLLAGAAESLWDEPLWRGVMLEKPEVWGAQDVTSSTVTMRIVVKTAPLRQWEIEREMRARVKAALDAAGIQPPA